MDSIPERVARGAALLDARLPGWARRIKLDCLRMGDTAHCILGQLGGDYARGCDLIGLVDNPSGEIAHGFDWQWETNAPERARQEEYHALDVAWRAAVTVRRAG